MYSGRKQLFDLADDPWETNDLIGDPAHAATARSLGAALQQWMHASGDPLGKKSVAQGTGGGVRNATKKGPRPK